MNHVSGYVDEVPFAGEEYHRLNRYCGYWVTPYTLQLCNCVAYIYLELILPIPCHATTTNKLLQGARQTFYYGKWYNKWKM